MRRVCGACLVVLALWFGVYLPARAQEEPATLIADRIAFDSEAETLTAEGNVEILQAGRRLNASRIVYDGPTDRITVTGPITLQDGTETVILADMAELSADMQNGILTGARLVLNRRLQIAAAEIRRKDGRFTQLRRTVASSCRICANNPTPIWEIRADSVTHDQVRRRLYFERARLRVFGVPVAYVPRLRLPDPTVKRATGFLVPQFRTTDNLGTGVKLPYFITLGDHADLTVTPYVTTTESQTLEMAYRRRFARGDLNIEGALTTDELTSDQFRGYVFADGWFDVANGFTAVFDVEVVSDPGYLLEYGYSDKDRLDSEFRLTRTRRDEHIEAGIIAFRTLRDDESNSTTPTLVGDASFTRRFTPELVGGIATLSLQTHGHLRTSDTNGVAGRDLLRASAQSEWRRNWVLNNGMVVSSLAALHADIYGIRQDSAFSGNEFRATPYAGVELRWPLIKVNGGTSHVIEPIAQLIWSPDSGTTVPNEDSVLVEFDETNLFSLSRFSGIDAVERGLRANLGVAYTRQSAKGWTTGLFFGRVIRARNLNQFTAPSGLSGKESDWVATFHLSRQPGLSLINRVVFDDDLSLSKAELRLDYATERLDLSSSFVWLEEDPAEQMTDDISEWSFNIGYQLRDQWRASANWRYDAVAEEPTRAGMGLTYENECISVDLSLSRRFTSSTNVRSSTNFGLAVSFTGFGDRGGRPTGVRKCTG